MSSSLITDHLDSDALSHICCWQCFCYLRQIFITTQNPADIRPLNIFQRLTSYQYEPGPHVSKVRVLKILLASLPCPTNDGIIKGHMVFTKSSEPTVASKESDIFHKTFTKATTSSRLVVVLIRSSGDSRIFKALVCLRSFNGMPNYMKKNMNDENTFWWLFFTVSKTPVTTISKTSRCPTIPNCFQAIWGT